MCQLHPSFFRLLGTWVVLGFKLVLHFAKHWCMMYLAVRDLAQVKHPICKQGRQNGTAAGSKGD